LKKKIKIEQGLFVSISDQVPDAERRIYAFQANKRTTKIKHPSNDKRTLGMARKLASRNM